ncbi:MAG: DUF5673 domain-containing protein [Patescibacteria group bacterium]
MNEGETIKWQELEYEDKKRSTDWFWALGVIVIASSAAAIIYENYFFAILLVLGGLMLGYFAIKKPDMIFYELGEKGLKINTDFYPYEKIKSFYISTETKPTLFLKSGRMFMPVMTITLEYTQIEKIKNLMLSKNIPEEEMKGHISEKIMDSLGF